MRELVTDVAALAHGRDEAAAAQAAQVVRNIGAAFTERFGELGGICGAVEQAHKNPTPDAVGKRGTDPLQYVEIHRSRRDHDDHVNSSVMPVLQRRLNHHAGQNRPAARRGSACAEVGRCVFVDVPATVSLNANEGLFSCEPKVVGPGRTARSTSNGDDDLGVLVLCGCDKSTGAVDVKFVAAS